MICPDCQRDVTGLVRCPCGALVGHVARRPVQESIPDRGEVAPEKRARIRDILSKAGPLDRPRRDPVEHWFEVLNTKGLSEISYRFAREALAKINRPSRREREPGEDWEEDAAAPIS